MKKLQEVCCRQRSWTAGCQSWTSQPPGGGVVGDGGVNGEEVEEGKGEGEGEKGKRIEGEGEGEKEKRRKR